MRSFREFLVEAEMSYQDAVKVFGLPDSFSAADVKKRYRQLAVQNHPDRGGSDVDMQRINAAYSKLSSGGAKQQVKPWMSDEDMAKMAKVALKAIEDNFDPQAFKKHFEDIFGEEFSFKITKTDVNKRLRNYVDFAAEFSNASSDTVCSLSISVNFVDMFRPTLGHRDRGLNMVISTSILHNRRKIKLSNRNYRFTADYNVLPDPERLFPSSKLKVKKDTEKSRKMSKRDVILTLQK